MLAEEHPFTAAPQPEACASLISCGSGCYVVNILLETRPPCMDAIPVPLLSRHVSLARQKPPPSDEKLL